MATAEFDSSLLFGILALQNGLIQQPDLIAAFQCWFQEQSQPMDEVLIERGALTESDRTMLDALIRRHAERRQSEVGRAQRGGDVPGSLLPGSFSAPGPDGRRADLLAGLS